MPRATNGFAHARALAHFRQSKTVWAMEIQKPCGKKIAD